MLGHDLANDALRLLLLINDRANWLTGRLKLSAVRELRVSDLALEFADQGVVEQIAHRDHPPTFIGGAPGVPGAVAGGALCAGAGCGPSTGGHQASSV